MPGVAMGSTDGTKALGSGWQVWGNPPTSRNASTLSTIAVAESSVSQADSHFRSSLSDTWGSRSTGGAWDEMTDSAQRMDLVSFDAQSGLPLHQGRQRHITSSQSTAALSSPSATASKQGQFSPQPYPTSAGRDPTHPARYLPTSPAKPGNYGYSTSPYAGQQPLMHGGSPAVTYDSLQPSSNSEDELSVALRGMAVADDYSLSQQSQAFREQTGVTSPSSASVQATQPSANQLRSHPQVQQHRMAYGGYPQTDYQTYYNGTSAGLDCSDAYDAYHAASDPSLYAPSPALSAATPAPNMYHAMGPPSLMPHTAIDLHNPQSGVFYDYTGSSRTMGSQYYYPPQPVMYHPHPSQSPV
ncbi:uncharacterized protein LAESUDRAFT_633478, partial [Laetiporus sulphureus 93-53]